MKAYQTLPATTPDQFRHGADIITYEVIDDTVTATIVFFQAARADGALTLMDTIERLLRAGYHITDTSLNGNTYTLSGVRAPISTMTERK